MHLYVYVISMLRALLGPCKRQAKPATSSCVTSAHVQCPHMAFTSMICTQLHALRKLATGMDAPMMHFEIK